MTKNHKKATDIEKVCKKISEKRRVFIDDTKPYFKKISELNALLKAERTKIAREKGVLDAHIKTLCEKYELKEGSIRSIMSLNKLEEIKD